MSGKYDKINEILKTNSKEVNAQGMLFLSRKKNFTLEERKIVDLFCLTLQSKDRLNV